MKKCKQGFTLIELLVVISIIAVLMSIMMPALGRAREQAKRVMCGNNVKQFGLANQMYATEFDGWYIPILNDINKLWCINPKMLDYMGINPNEVGIDNSTGINVISLSKDFKCPSDKRKEGQGIYKTTTQQIDMSYGYNMMSLDVNCPKSGGGWHYGQHNGHRASKISNPSQKLAFADGTDYGLWDVSADYVRFWDGAKFKDWCGPTPDGSTWVWNKTSYRHDEGANIAFFDGHFEYRKKEAIYIKTTPSNVTAEREANEALWIPIPGKRIGTCVN